MSKNILTHNVIMTVKYMILYEALFAQKKEYDNISLTISSSAYLNIIHTHKIMFVYWGI